MKDNIKVELNTGTLFLELMFLMFLGLKISGMIDWSWWWVFAPLWMPLGIAVLVVGVMAIGVAISVKMKKGKK